MTVISSRDFISIRPRTEHSRNDYLFDQWPFQGSSVEQIVTFTIQHSDQTDLSPANLIILDACMTRDNKCLLLSRNQLSGTENPWEWLYTSAV
jgi:hypothetical protein